MIGFLYKKNELLEGEWIKKGVGVRRLFTGTRGQLPGQREKSLEALEINAGTLPEHGLGGFR